MTFGSIQIDLGELMESFVVMSSCAELGDGLLEAMKLAQNQAFQIKVDCFRCNAVLNGGRDVFQSLMRVSQTEVQQPSDQKQTGVILGNDGNLENSLQSAR